MFHDLLQHVVGHPTVDAVLLVALLARPLPMFLLQVTKGHLYLYLNPNSSKGSPPKVMFSWLGSTNFLKAPSL